MWAQEMLASEMAMVLAVPLPSFLGLNHEHLDLAHEVVSEFKLFRKMTKQSTF